MWTKPASGQVSPVEMRVRTSAWLYAAHGAGTVPVATSGYARLRWLGPPNRSASPTSSTLTDGITSPGGRRAIGIVAARTPDAIFSAARQGVVGGNVSFVPLRPNPVTSHGNVTFPPTSAVFNAAAVMVSLGSP